MFPIALISEKRMVRFIVNSNYLIYFNFPLFLISEKLYLFIYSEYYKKRIVRFTFF